MERFGSSLAFQKRTRVLEVALEHPDLMMPLSGLDDAA